MSNAWKDAAETAAFAGVSAALGVAVYELGERLVELACQKENPAKKPAKKKVKAKSKKKRI